MVKGKMTRSHGKYHCTAKCGGRYYEFFGDSIKDIWNCMIREQLIDQETESIVYFDLGFDKNGLQKAGDKDYLKMIEAAMDYDYFLYTITEKNVDGNHSIFVASDWEDKNSYQ